MSAPIYVTLTSTGSSPWRVTNWAANPSDMGFAVISSGGSSFTIDGTLEDPTGTYPNPRSSTPTAFALLTGSTGAATYLTGITSVPIAAYRLTLNSISSVGAPVTLVSFQSGIG